MIARVATASLLLAEAMVVATFAEFLAASYSGSMPHAVAGWAFAITALAGFAVPRFVEGFDLPAGRAYAITGAVGLLLIYALTRITVVGDIAIWDLSWIGDFLRDSQEAAQRGGHAIVGAVLLLVVWARANLRAADDIEMETMPRLVTIPFAITTAVVILGAMGDRSGEVGRAGAAFYVFAVLALVCSQLSLSGATYGDMRAGGTAGILLAGTAAVALAALLVIGLFVAVLGPVIGPPQMTADTAREAYEKAGIGPEDLDLVQVHDAFPIEELVYYELLGICREGEGDRLIADGETAIGGRIPFSTDGGLIARGHPEGPTGLAQIHETVTQLRGEAGARQVDGAKIGLCHLVGAGSVCVVHVLAR